jgi:NTE family protein
MARPKAKPKTINLALQGGGAHGAFAWGVLDRLLEDERLDFEGIVGTSAGAMNAVVMAYGLATGGRDGARAKLREFWKKVSDAARHSPLQPTMWDRLLKPGGLEFSPGYMFFDALSRVLSPYQTNPMNMNPLRDVLAGVVDCAKLHGTERVKLYICASNVLSGKIRVFDTKDVSIDAVMASACLPFMFQAVEIDGEHYWDGGYMGNPALFPLIYNCGSDDIVIVQINPMKRPEPPRTANEILNRINEISFNATLNREVRAIAFVRKLIDDENLDPKKYRRVNLHMIESEDCMSVLGVSSKLNAEWDFLMHLKEIGRDAAAAWLEAHFDQIGVETTVDMQDKFL